MAQRLKGPERDSEGQSQARKGLQRAEGNSSRDLGNVFKDAQQRQIENNASPQGQGSWFSPEPFAQQEIRDDRGDEYGSEPWHPGQVERETRGEKDNLAQTVSANLPQNDYAGKKNANIASALEQRPSGPDRQE